MKKDILTVLAFLVLAAIASCGDDTSSSKDAQADTDAQADVVDGN